MDNKTSVVILVKRKLFPEYGTISTYSGAYPFNIPGLQSAAERAEKGSF